MGLDQYATSITSRGLTLREQMQSIPTSEERKAFAQKNNLDQEIAELCYWRKHANLNEWMTQLAVSRGVVSDAGDFNCVDLVLTSEDIDALEQSINGGNLPHGEGFFWGASDERDTKLDRVFIQNARQAFLEGKQVVYSCWW